MSIQTLCRTAVYVFLVMTQISLSGQQISKDYLLHLTREWEGDRFEDGRPRVSDEILDRMKLVTRPWERG